MIPPECSRGFCVDVTMVKKILFVCVALYLICRAKSQGNSEDDENNGTSKQVQNRQRCPVLSEKEYSLALSLLRRNYAVPVGTRTSQQKKVYRKISLYKLERCVTYDPYLGKKLPRIVMNKKILLPSNEVEHCIRSYYFSSKGDGAKKLSHNIRKNYFGIGEKKIQACLNNLESHRKRQPRFENKAPLHCIMSKNIMERHQIDLVDFTNIAVTIGTTKYRYVLSVLDTFSRFIWLRALPDKSAITVASELYKLYVEYGPPKILQSDQGSEFKGIVKELCNHLKTKLIYSSSGHPQSQGKSERSHRTWKEKIRCDILATASGGICDWVTGLPIFQRLYNEGWHRSIGMSPYECMFGITSNNVLNKCLNKLEIENIDESQDAYSNATQEELKEHVNMLKSLRSQAHQSSKTSSEKLVKTNLAKKPPSKYKVGDKVLIRHIGKDKRVIRGGKSIKAPKVYEGTIIQTNIEKHKYKIEITNSLGKSESKWFSVNFITAKDHNVEKSKKEEATKESRHKTINMTRKKCETISKRRKPKQNKEMAIMEQLQALILESIRQAHDNNSHMSRLLYNAEKNNLELHTDNSGNGNCMFMALQHQLLTHGIDLEHLEIRRRLVAYIRENPVLRSQNNHIDLRSFIYNTDGWEQYLEDMASEGEWGDNIMLMAAANVFRSRIIIISSLRSGNNVVIDPIGEPTERILYLGHLHEFHYVSLMQSEPYNNILCEQCGRISSTTHICNEVDMNVRTDNEPHLPLSKVQIENLLKSVNTMTRNITNDNVDETQKSQRVTRLAKDQNSMLWAFFMQNVGFIFEEDIIDNETFLIVPTNIMDIFDDFREKLKLLCGTLSIFFLTQAVKMWLDQLEQKFQMEVQEICPRIYLLTRLAALEFYNWIETQGDHAEVERDFDQESSM